MIHVKMESDFKYKLDVPTEIVKRLEVNEPGMEEILVRIEALGFRWKYDQIGSRLQLIYNIEELLELMLSTLVSWADPPKETESIHCKLERENVTWMFTGETMRKLIALYEKELWDLNTYYVSKVSVFPNRKHPDRLVLTCPHNNFKSCKERIDGILKELDNLHWTVIPVPTQRIPLAKEFVAYYRDRDNVFMCLREGSSPGLLIQTRIKYVIAKYQQTWQLWLGQNLSSKAKSTTIALTNVDACSSDDGTHAGKKRLKSREDGEIVGDTAEKCRKNSPGKEPENVEVIDLTELSDDDNEGEDNHTLFNLNTNCISIRVYNPELLQLNGVESIALVKGEPPYNEFLQRAGPVPKEEVERFTRTHGNLSVSNCCVTSAGDLAYKGVIHIAPVSWTGFGNKEDCARAIYETVRNVLLKAEKAKFRTVAIPAKVSGSSGVPSELCAEMILKAVKEYNHQRESAVIKEVHVVDTSPNHAAIFRDVEETWERNPFSTARFNGIKRKLSLEGLQQHVSCSICLDLMQDPLTLSCGHSFCKQCIQMVVEYQSIPCPECRSVTHLAPSRGVDGLPRAHHLRNIVDTIQNAQQA